MAEFFVSTTAAGSYLPAGWRLPELRATAQGEAPVSVGGGFSLAFDCDEEDGDRGRKASSDATDDSAGPSSKPAPRGKARGVSPGVGNALREAYQEALREDVPPEMLDLLGKLG